MPFKKAEHRWGQHRKIPKQTGNGSNCLYLAADKARESFRFLVRRPGIKNGTKGTLGILL